MAEEKRSASDEDATEIVCTAIEADWGNDRPNLLMHPPCQCANCAPQASLVDDDGSWLQVPGQRHRFRVERAELGATGRSLLG